MTATTRVIHAISCVYLPPQEGCLAERRCPWRVSRAATNIKWRIPFPKLCSIDRNIFCDAYTLLLNAVALLFAFCHFVHAPHTKRWPFDIFTSEHELQANDLHPAGYGGLTVSTRLRAIGFFHVIDQNRIPPNRRASAQAWHKKRALLPVPFAGGHSERINVRQFARQKRFIAYLT